MYDRHNHGNGSWVCGRRSQSAAQLCPSPGGDRTMVGDGVRGEGMRDDGDVPSLPHEAAPLLTPVCGHAPHPTREVTPLVA